MHCTDVKRHTLYIKSNGEWTKDTDTVNTIIAELVKHATCACMKRLSDWKKENPDYQDGNSDFSGRCVYMMGNTLKINGGANPDQRIKDKLCVLTKITIDQINENGL